MRATTDITRHWFWCPEKCAFLASHLWPAMVLHLNVYLQATVALPRAQSKQARLSVAHLAPFCPPKGPKNGAAKLPTCPALVRKVSRANRSASCSLPLRSRHRRRHRATHLLADLPTHTRRGTVAFKSVEAGSCVCSQPALPLVAAAPCMRERLGSEKR